MMNPISSSMAAQTYIAPPPPSQAKPASAPAAPPQDSVKLSSQATGDVDHDGDSH
jgi:hypothetical protein